MKSLKSILEKLRNETTSHAGFTLVELLVSIMVFSLSMGVISQLFSYSIRAERILVAHSQLINEISYDMEHISRGLRMAKKSVIGGNCLSDAGVNFEPIYGDDGGIHGIKFQSPKASDVPNAPDTYDCVTYYKGMQDGVAALMEHRVSSDGSSFDLPLTSPDVELITFNIKNFGWIQGDDLQPRVTFILEMKGRENQSIKIQTTVSQRDADVNELD